MSNRAGIYTYSRVFIAVTLKQRHVALAAIRAYAAADESTVVSATFYTLARFVARVLSDIRQLQRRISATLHAYLFAIADIIKFRAIFYTHSVLVEEVLAAIAHAFYGGIACVAYPVLVLRAATLLLAGESSIFRSKPFSVSAFARGHASYLQIVLPIRAVYTLVDALFAIVSNEVPRRTAVHVHDHVSGLNIMLQLVGLCDTSQRRLVFKLVIA